MRTHLYFAILVLGMLLVASCEQKEESIVAFEETSGITVKENAQCSSVIDYIGDDLALTQFFDDTQIKLKGARVNNDKFILESSVTSPNIDGALLSASYVEVLRMDSKVSAYVTYNLSGSAHGGALVVLDLTDPQNPQITKEIIFDDIDLNVCEVYHGGKMLWVGGSSFKKGAVVIPLELDDDGVVIADSGNDVSFEVITIKNVASVNGIKEAGDWLMVTAGNSGGGTFALNYKKGYRIDAVDEFANAKFSTSNGYALGKYHASLEGGSDAKLHVYRIGVEDEETESIISLGEIYHNVSNVADKYAGKATCFMEENSRFCYVSLGHNGFMAVDIFDQNTVLKSSAGLIDKGNTNGISVDDSYIYLANGADGLVICEKPEMSFGDDPVIVEPLYVWDEETESASANFVTVKDDYIFVAKGANGGLKIVKKLFE